MKKRNAGVLVAGFLILSSAHCLALPSDGLGIEGPIYPVPRFGSFYSLAHTNWPAAPCPPTLFTNAVYAITSWPGHYFYDDLDNPDHNGGLSRSEMQTSEESGGDEPGPLDFGTYGTNLFIMVGLTNSGQAWLSLSNTHSGTYYQILNRPDISSPPWTYGQIRQASSSLTPFDNVPTYDHETRFFRGVGGDTVASVVLDPDYNLAVEPATNGGSGQIGKFRVALNPAPASARTVVYKISGTTSNGVDCTNLTGTVSVSTSGSADITIQPLYDTNAEFYETLTLSLVLTNGYLVHPNLQSATIQIYDPRPDSLAVAILDSGWTKLLWQNTNWNYFVLPEALKEMLRSDGTPFAVFSDLDVKNGALMTTNGLPKYPILIDLAGEVIRDDEIAPLTNYVASGGFIFAGSSAFTRFTNGTYRGNFALTTNQMGISCNASSNNWTSNYGLTKQADHRLTSHLPANYVNWRMPSHADEISWGSCATTNDYTGTHLLWQTTNSSAQILVLGDFNTFPYLTYKAYGDGYFIYDAALQPLIAHGGNGPGMYTYMIFRRAVEWAFESAQKAVVRLSPWPYQYDSAFMVRHDLENYVTEIARVSDSAQYEYQHGATGDYYFCTGAITNQGNFDDIVAGLRSAVGAYGATVGSHNGGLPNPRATSDTNSACHMSVDDYQYFHWGPDMVEGTGYGYDYVSNSVAISFAQIEAWVTNQPSDPRVWVIPYFDGTREDSYKIQEQLNVKITGEQKISPFPHWNLSTRNDGKRYSFLSEPVSEWFVGDTMAQVVGPWQNRSSGPGVHTQSTLQAAVDFYYTNGFLINFYSHSLTAALAGTSDDRGGAADLMADYVSYCTNHARIWSANAKSLYTWCLNRSTALVTATYTTNGTHSVATISITGAQDTNTTVEIFGPGSQPVVVGQLRTNTVLAATNSYRTSGQLIKIRVGTTVTNVQIEYFPGPVARSDNYVMSQGQSLTIATNSGVLTNDWAGAWSGLRATTNSLPQHGSLSWDANGDGGFTYTPTNTFTGPDCFTYLASDGTNSFGQPT
jgi:hypothetical protein